MTEDLDPELALRCVKTWCVQAVLFDRQAIHRGEKIGIWEALPGPLLEERARALPPAPHPLLRDDQLDAAANIAALAAVNPKAKRKAKAKAKGAVPGAKAKAKAKAKKAKAKAKAKVDSADNGSGDMQVALVMMHVALVILQMALKIMQVALVIVQVALHPAQAARVHPAPTPARVIEVCICFPFPPSVLLLFLL